MTASAVMTPVVTVSPDDSWLAAVRKISEHHVHALPVVDPDRRGVGMIAESDLMARDDRARGDDSPVRHDRAGHAARRGGPDHAPTAVEQEVREALQSGGAVARGVEACVRDAVVELTGTTRYRTEADVVRRTATQVPGVVDVNSRLAWDVDDVYTAAGGSDPVPGPAAVKPGTPSRRGR